jgi:hypothetical protein
MRLTQNDAIAMATIQNRRLCDPNIIKRMGGQKM